MVACEAMNDSAPTAPSLTASPQPAPAPAVALALGLLVGVIYALFQVRSPAPLTFGDR